MAQPSRSKRRQQQQLEESLREQGVRVPEHASLHELRTMEQRLAVTQRSTRPAAC